MLIKGEPVHIATANKVTMSCKATGLTCPISAFGLVLVPTYRTLATRSSFRASEAHDVGLLGFVGEIVDIFAVLPHSHTLIVVSSAIPIADTMGITDCELAQGVFIAVLAGEVSAPQKAVWEGPLVVKLILCWHGWQCLSRSYPPLHYRVPSKVAGRREGRFHPHPLKGMGLPAPIRLIRRL